DGHFPLRQFEFELVVKRVATGQPPTVTQLVGRQQPLFFRRNAQSATQNANTATFASAAPAAGELDALIEENVLQARAFGRFQARARGGKAHGVNAAAHAKIR
ncbi:MAG: hypothetical protein RMK20_09875, partial [Verrucomicrobiales bacterium]|nr:hypothetical protein [Verrucomicrobiales bacterium]